MITNYNACWPAPPKIFESTGNCLFSSNSYDIRRTMRWGMKFRGTCDRPNFLPTSVLPQFHNLFPSSGFATLDGYGGKILCVYISVKRQVFSSPCHLLWTHMICLCSKCLPCPTRTGEGHKRTMVQTRSKQEEEQCKEGGSSSPSHCRLTSQWTAKCSLPV